VEYRYATSQPDSRMDKGFETAPADLSESGPHVSIAGYSPALERAHHHELSVSRRVGKNNLQMAVYSDRVADPALTGVGDFAAENAEVLPDLYSGTFTYRGKELHTRGLRVVLQRKLSSDVTATLDYGYGGVLDLANDDIRLEDARESIVIRDHVQRFRRAVGSLSQHLLPPAYPGNQFSTRAHGCADRCAQLVGSGLCSVNRAG
jgi:hypothetical protein